MDFLVTSAVDGCDDSVEKAMQMIRELVARRVVVDDDLRVLQTYIRGLEGLALSHGFLHPTAEHMAAGKRIFAALGDAVDAPVERTEGAGRTQGPGWPLPVIDDERGA